MTTPLSNMPSLLTIKVAAPAWATSSMDAELCEHDLALDFDDDNDLSDDSSVTSYMHSPVTTPTATLNTKTVASSPCAVDDMAFATSSCTWSSESSRPARRKRARMSEEERKVRHREVQREFMKRKRARIAVLRKEQVGVEKQLRLVRVMLEVAMLKKEQQSLTEQYEMCERGEVVEKEESTECEQADTPVAAVKTFEGLVFSLPSEETYEDYTMTDADWSDLYEMLSDESDEQGDASSVKLEEVDSISDEDSVEAATL